MQPASFRLKEYPEIEILEYGNPSAHPIIVFHDELTGDAFLYHWLKNIPAVKDKRFLVILRPGYGKSKFDPNVSIKNLMADICISLLKQLSIKEPIALLSHGNGFYFALHCGNKLGAACAHVIGICPMLPVLSDEQIEDMPKYHRFIRSTITKSPAMGEFAIKAGYKLFCTIGPHNFAKIIYTDPHDTALLNNHDIKKALEFGARLHGDSHQPLLQDELTVSSGWQSLLKSKLPPIHIILGQNESQSTWKRLKPLTDNINHLSIKKGSASKLVAFNNMRILSDLI